MKLNIQLFADGGTITIETVLDTKGFEEDLKKLEKTDEEVEVDALLKDIEIPTEEAQAIMDELNENMSLDLDTQSFDMQIAKAKLDILKYRTLLENADKLELSNDDVVKYAEAIEKTNNHLNQLIEKKEKLQNAGANQLSKQFENLGKEIGKSIRNLAKMALAVFGIRGAINGVRNAMNTISQGDKDLKNDIQFIKTALAYVIEPVVRRIVSIMKTLAQYVQYVVKAWTGRDIFASAKKNLKAGAKSAKEINKSMAGFDEAQTLQKSGGGDSGGGIGNIQPLAEGEVPAWLQWIADNKDTVLAVIAGLVAGITAFNVGFSALQALGIGIAIAGVVEMVQKIIDFINDPTWENFIGILEGIAIAVGGVAIAFGAWPVAIGAAVALVFAEILKHYDKIVELMQKGIDWLDTNVLGWLEEKFGILGTIMYLPIKFFVEQAKGTFESFFGGIKKMFEGVMQIIDGDFWGGIKTIFGGMLSVLTAPLQGFLKAVKSVWEKVKEIFTKIKTWVKDKFITPIKEKVTEFGTKVGDTIANAFKAVVNGILGAIESVLNKPIKAINKLIDVINDVPGIELGKLKTFNLPRLAKGGIVNMPGKGVPVGGAIAGERGPEGVIPFTDAQQMELIGQAIGRYVTINLTNITKLDSRQLAKEIRKVMAENDFATNGW